jgi:hypothetical protein
MAKTEYVYLQGKTKWFRHTAPDKWGKWKHLLYPNKESLEKLRELQSEGLKNVIHKDDDGEYVYLSRATQKMINGKVVGFAPPEVLGPDGKTPLRDVMIGNGSDVTTKLEVYSHGTPSGGKAKAARWASTRVDNLVPFEGKRDFSEDEEKQVRGLDQQPEQKQTELF